jgi:hypothetical protein
MPVRDDWTSATELVRRLNQTLSQSSYLADVLLIDDGSVERCAPDGFGKVVDAIRPLRILRLRRNVGHQRAIAIGLGYAAEHCSCDALLVMDGDGEDTPGGALQLLDAYRGLERKKAVFAERVRRSESFQFRLFYKLYRLVHWLLTGIKVRVGNISVLPGSFLDTVGVLSELWNHYAAAIFNSRLPYSMVPIERGKRIDGASKMNFVALVTHGLSAVSVFGDRVGVRVLLASLAGATCVLVAIGTTISVRLWSNLAIPGWATYIDVLEHIDDDHSELKAAAAKLKVGGRLIVLAPAHQRLFTPFDQSVGHFRRYNRNMMRDAAPPELKVERIFYLDSVGLLASLANKLFLKQSMPTKEQLHVWDSWMIPVSRVIDPLLFRSIGKTVVGIWSKS